MVEELVGVEVKVALLPILVACSLLLDDSGMVGGREYRTLLAQTAGIQDDIVSDTTVRRANFYSNRRRHVRRRSAPKDAAFGPVDRL